MGGESDKEGEEREKESDNREVMGISRSWYEVYMC